MYTCNNFEIIRIFTGNKVGKIKKLPFKTILVAHVYMFHQQSQKTRIIFYYNLTSCYQECFNFELDRP